MAALLVRAVHSHSWIMEAVFQIVGCVFSMEPATERIDHFVSQARRERAVITVKSARQATFVRFGASDARLIAIACRTVRGPAGSSLRFGFAAGVARRAPAARGGASVSTRDIAQASDLAAGARDGEVLLSPQLAALLENSGFRFQTKAVHLPGDRAAVACSLDGEDGSGTERDEPAAREKADPRGEELDDSFRGLTAQADNMNRKQRDLEARQDVLLDKLIRASQRLERIDEIESRIERLHRAALAVETRLAEQQAREVEWENLKSLCDALRVQVDRVRQDLTRTGEVQQELLPIASQVATLSQTLEQSQQAVAALEDRLTRSKADLQFVSEHRGDVTELRAKVEDLLGRVDETDGKLVLIESRRKMVEEVQSRADSITAMLGDIHVNLEMLSEQRAVIDLVGEKLARLDFTAQEAQNTLRALQREREMAERIEQGIRALRAGGSAKGS